MSDMERELQEIFQRVFNNQTVRITRELTARDVPEWDSLSNVNLILAIEEHFQVKFAIRDVARLNNVGELMDLIARKKSAP
jgi:acyl carrier protein